MTGYDAGHAEGFIRLFGLPLATAARREAENGAKKDGPAKNATRRSSKAALRGEERSDALEARGGRRRSALRGARRSQDGGAERAARSSSPLKAAVGTGTALKAPSRRKTHVR